MKRLIAGSLAFSIASFCQTPSNTQLTARQVVERSIAAMATSSTAATIKDFRLTGSMRMAGAGAASPVKIASRGADDMRLDITLPEGDTHTVTFLHGRGSITDAGKQTPVSSTARAGTEIAFLPTPAVLADLLVSAREITDMGSSNADGRPVRHVMISRQYPKEMDPTGLMTARSKTELFIDAESFLILKIRHPVYDTRGEKASQRQLDFSDYRSVGGLMLPFSLVETSDGQKSWVITVESIELNPKLTDNDFKL